MTKEARTHQAPMRILRVLLAAYRWARLLLLEGVTTGALWPQNGVAAGCWAALSCLKIFLAETLRAQEMDYIFIQLTIHVDDILQEVTGDSEKEIVERAKVGARHLWFRLNVLGLEIATDKTAIAASSMGLEELALAELGEL